jgi:dynein heavy chain
MITKEGLEAQLLELTVSKEKPELEETRNNIIVQNHNNTLKLAQIEKTILQTLSKTEGNILDDDAAITALQDSKKTSKEIEL